MNGCEVRGFVRKAKPLTTDKEIIDVVSKGNQNLSYEL